MCYLWEECAGSQHRSFLCPPVVQYYLQESKGLLLLSVPLFCYWNQCDWYQDNWHYITSYIHLIFQCYFYLTNYRYSHFGWWSYFFTVIEAKRYLEILCSCIFCVVPFSNFTLLHLTDFIAILSLSFFLIFHQMLWEMFNLNSIKEKVFMKYCHLNKIRLKLEGMIEYSQKNDNFRNS